MNQKLVWWLGGIFLLFGIFNMQIPEIAAAAENNIQLPICRTENQFKTTLYHHLMNRDTKFQIIYQGDGVDLYGDDPEELFEEIWEINKATSDDFDYLHYNVKDYTLEAETSESNTIFKFNIAYYESATQLLRTNAAAQKLVKQLTLAEDSAANKVRKIHDALVARHDYVLNQTKTSAYSALVKKSASSRGYALATYKVLTELEIPCRIIVGELGGSEHFWNIVKLDDRWYGLDNALDISDLAIVPLRYDYFLVGTKQLSRDHQLAKLHEMVEFASEYPLSIENYPGRNKLILAADAERAKEKLGVGSFNEAYNLLSVLTVDSFEKVNDKISDIALDSLADVFMGI